MEQTPRISVCVSQDTLPGGSSVSNSPSVGPYSNFETPVDNTIQPYIENSTDSPTRSRGPATNLLELANACSYAYYASSRSSFLAPMNNLRSRRLSTHSSDDSVQGIDNDGPRNTGVQRNSQEAREDLEAQSQQTSRLSSTSRKELAYTAKRLTIEFNITCMSSLWMSDCVVAHCRYYQQSKTVTNFLSHSHAHSSLSAHRLTVSTRSSQPLRKFSISLPNSSTSRASS